MACMHPWLGGGRSNLSVVYWVSPLIFPNGARWMPWALPMIPLRRWRNRPPGRTGLAGAGGLSKKNPLHNRERFGSTPRFRETHISEGSKVFFFFSKVFAFEKASCFFFGGWVVFSFLKCFFCTGMRGARTGGFPSFTPWIAFLGKTRRVGKRSPCCWNANVRTLPKPKRWDPLENFQSFTAGLRWWTFHFFFGWERNVYIYTYFKRT